MCTITRPRCCSFLTAAGFSMRFEEHLAVEYLNNMLAYPDSCKKSSRIGLGKCKESVKSGPPPLRRRDRTQSNPHACHGCFSRPAGPCTPPFTLAIPSSLLPPYHHRSNAQSTLATTKLKELDSKFAKRVSLSLSRSGSIVNEALNPFTYTWPNKTWPRRLYTGFKVRRMASGLAP